MEQHRWARPLAASFTLFLALTFIMSLVRVARRATSPRARRARTVDLNKARECALTPVLAAPSPPACMACASRHASESPTRQCRSQMSLDA
jgi:hypothetical protein